MRYSSSLNRLTRRALTLVTVAAALVAPPTASAQRLAPAVRGQVTDSAGLPLAGTRVSITSLGRQGLTDAQGRYRFAQLATGGYTVVFSRVGFLPETRRVTVTDGETKLDIQLRPTRIELA